MKDSSKLKGRPVLATGKRTKKIDIRFTEKEFNIILAMEEQLGLNRTELIRTRVLCGTGQILLNASEMIRQLDLVGKEMGRIGNNINQVARYVNILQKKDILSAVVAERFDISFQQYHEIQKVLETALRKIFRQLVK